MNAPGPEDTRSAAAAVWQAKRRGEWELCEYVGEGYEKKRWREWGFGSVAEWLKGDLGRDFTGFHLTRILTVYRVLQRLSPEHVAIVKSFPFERVVRAAPRLRRAPEEGIAALRAPGDIPTKTRRHEHWMGEGAQVLVLVGLSPETRMLWERAVMRGRYNANRAIPTDNDTVREIAATMLAADMGLEDRVVADIEAGRYRCIECFSHERNLERHRVFPVGHGPYVWLCPPCLLRVRQNRAQWKRYAIKWGCEVPPDA
jgi:hypothetical protein